MVVGSFYLDGPTMMMIMILLLMTLMTSTTGADQEWVVVGGRELFDDDQHRAAVHDEFAIDLANIVPGLGEVGHHQKNHLRTSQTSSSQFHLQSSSSSVQGGEPVVLSGHEATQAEVMTQLNLMTMTTADAIEE